MKRNQISAKPVFTAIQTSTLVLSFSLLVWLPIRQAAAVEIEWTTVTHPNNAADTEVMVCCENYVGTSGYGAVPYFFRISRYETTNAQYAEFLNAVAATDTHALYNTSMGDPNPPNWGGITRSGHSGQFTYSAIAGRENMPVNYVGFYDAVRFANWLHNAQPTGAQDDTTTEDGAYTITAEGIANNTIARNPGATVFIPSEDEWYKAAYYWGALNRFYDYPSYRDEPMICEGPGGSTTRNAAACGHPLTDYTDVGSFTRSYSPSFTYDQGGNIWEWNENNAVCGVGCRGLRGGDFGSDPGVLAAAHADYRPVASESHQWGFRVAGLPNPIPPAFEASATLHTFGNDQVDGIGFPFDRKFFIARPLAARCNPSNGGVPCGTATLQQGATVVGSGTALLDTRVSPPGFTLPPSALRATVTGSLPQYPPYQFISTYVSGPNNTNQQPYFGRVFDYGKRTFSFPVYSGTKARVVINPGANRFGGTMRILATMGARRAHEFKNKVFLGTGRSLFGLQHRPCSITCYVIGGSAYFRSQQYESSMGDATTPEVISVGFPWTTGTVSVTATDGPFPTRFRRSGYDNRTAKGLGTIQLVAPQIVKWDFPNRGEPWDRYTGGIGILRIKFVPEPSGGLMTIAGIAFLSIGYKMRRIG